MKNTEKTILTIINAPAWEDEERNGMGNFFPTVNTYATDGDGNWYKLICRIDNEYIEESKEKEGYYELTDEALIEYKNGTLVDFTNPDTIIGPDGEEINVENVIIM